MTKRALLSAFSLLCVALAAMPSVASAELKSPFPSTVSGVEIPNAHIVHDGKGLVIRGGTPGRKLQQLLDRGVTDFVVFKNSINGDIEREAAELRALGVPAGRIHLIPFRWKEIESFQAACEQTVRALRVLVGAARTEGRGAYFHCTVGEDRTGYLAALFRLLRKGSSLERVFRQEMCENGYEAGNPQKPAKVVAAIREELTPVFLRMVALIESGALTARTLDPAVCASEPIPARDPSRFRCSTSSKYAGR